MRLLIVLAVLGTAVTAHARTRQHEPPAPPTFFERFTAAFDGLLSPFKPKEVFATYYGGSDGLCGRPTASGKPLDCAAMTAAHPTLPLGSRAYVCGPAACRMLLIEDRGPYANGAGLDMTPAAALAICGRLTSCYVRFWPM